MPATVTIGAFVFGAVLLLLALVGGGIKIFGAEITGTVGKVARTLAFVLGLVFVTLGITGLDPKPDPTNKPDTFNLSGIWRDDFGTTYDVSQTGNRYEFTADNSDNRFDADGQGTIVGSRFHSEYIRNGRIKGTSEGQISEDGNISDATFHDDELGTFQRRLQRHR
jgi:hypothetical protein